MSSYGVKEARISRERKPRVNLCGSCGEECDSLLCDDCRGTLPSQQEDDVNRETR